MYRIHQIKLKPGEPHERIPEKIMKKLGPASKGLLIDNWKIVRESIDARDKENIRLVYSVDFSVVSAKNPKKAAALKTNPKLGLETAPDMVYREVCTAADARAMVHRPVIVGFGPAGMFAGLALARAGYRPVILERGQDVDARTAAVEHFWETGELDTESNVQFGEGGAGTFSDGKLTTGIKDPRISKVLEELVRFGAPADIMYRQKPHVGTDILRTVVKAMREEIRSLGGEVRFGCRVSDVLTGNQWGAAGMTTGADVAAVTGVKLSDGSIIECETVIFAIGHSSRDTLRWMRTKGIDMAQKPFSIGVRIEHPQEIIDIAQYGAPASEIGLPAADYKLNHRCENGRGVYTFCMCPGGQVVIASSQEGGVVTNGMSYHNRASGTANSALLCDVRVSDFGSEDVLAGVEFQEKYERLAFINGGGRYKAPKCTWGQFRDYKVSAKNATAGGDAEGARSCAGTENATAGGSIKDASAGSDRARAVDNSLPEFAAEAIREAMPHLGRKLKGFDSDDAVMTAVEARSSSPVRFARDESMTGSIEGRRLEGFYPCGEGAGYAGGIMSAAVDGIKAAEAIIQRWRAPIA